MDLNFQYPNQPEPVEEENQGMYWFLTTMVKIILVTHFLFFHRNRSRSSMAISVILSTHMPMKKGINVFIKND